MEFADAPGLAMRPPARARPPQAPARPSVADKACGFFGTAGVLGLPVSITTWH